MAISSKQLLSNALRCLEGATNQPTSSSIVPNHGIQAGDHVFVPARPDWGLVEVTDTSDGGLLLIRAGATSNAPIIKIGRAAVCVPANSPQQPSTLPVQADVVQPESSSITPLTSTCSEPVSLRSASQNNTANLPARKAEASSEASTTNALAISDLPRVVAPRIQHVLPLPGTGKRRRVRHKVGDRNARLPSDAVGNSSAAGLASGDSGACGSIRPVDCLWTSSGSITYSSPFRSTESATRKGISSDEALPLLGQSSDLINESQATPYLASTVDAIDASVNMTQPALSCLTDEAIITGSYYLVRDLPWDDDLRFLLPQEYDGVVDAPISKLGLSVRALNGLQRGIIVTVGDLLSVTIADLMQLHHIGLRSVWNIIQCLHASTGPVVNEATGKSPIHPLFPTPVENEANTAYLSSEAQLTQSSGTTSDQNTRKLGVALPQDASLQLGEQCRVRQVIDACVARRHGIMQQSGSSIQATSVVDACPQVPERGILPNDGILGLSDAAISTGSPQLVSELNWNTKLRNLLSIPQSREDLDRTPVSRLCLSVRSTNRVCDLNIETVGELLSVTIGDLMQVRHMGVRSVWDIIQCIHHFADAEVVTHARPPGRASTNEWPLESILSLIAGEGRILFDMTFSELDRKDKAAIRTLKLLDNARLIDFYSRTDAPNSGLRRRVINLTQSIYSAVALDGSWPDDDHERVSRYYRFVRKLDVPPGVSGVIGRRIAIVLSNKPVLLHVALARLCKSPMGLTLDAIGAQTNVSRERVRQQYMGALKELQDHPGFGQFVVQESLRILGRYGGQIAACELEAELLGDGTKQSSGGNPQFLKFATSLPEWENAGLVTADSMVQTRGNGDKVSAVLSRVIVDAAKRSADDNPGANLWSAPIHRVLAEVALIINADIQPLESNVCVSPEVLRRAINSQKELVRCDEERVYSRTYWELLGRGSRLQQVEAIVKHAGRPMHHSEITAELSRWFGGSLGRGAVGALERTADVLLWGRGVYVHRSWVRIPHALLQEIADWVDSRLAGGVPYVSVAGTFDAFADRCVTEGLPTRQALYSALRSEYASRFGITEYPYITRLGASEDRQPVGLLIEDFVRADGGYVTRNALVEYLVGELGVDAQMAPMHISNAPNVLSAHGNVVHADNLRVERGALSELSNICEYEVSRKGQVSVSELVKARGVLCVRLGLEDSRLIHSLLLHSSDGTLVGTYPHIAAATAGASVKSTLDIVASWVRERNRPCSTAEIKSQFVDGKGLGAQSVFSVVGRNRVVRYSHRSLIHLDSLGWDEDKQRDLEVVAQKQYEIACARGYLCTTASELLEAREDELPPLDIFVWTRTLLSELIRRNAHFMCVGNAMDAYLPVQSELHVRSLDDYLAQYLLRFHSGACQLTTLEEELREGGVIVKSLKQQMLGEHSQVVIDRDDVLTRRFQYAR